MKIVIACDSFKGSCSSIKAVRYIADGIRRVFPEAVLETLPIADGGEGMLEAVLAAAEGVRKYVTVADPLGYPRRASFGILNDKTAVIEMAEASGLTLIPKNALNPMAATTYGTGELIRAALDEGCQNIIVGIGGSATNDGGAGMAQALGVRFLDENGGELPYGGGALGRLHKIDVCGIDARLAETNIIIASDVSNPLCGENGAAQVYAAQKGATPEMIPILDDNLAHFARTAKMQLGTDIADKAGAGAAGGLGAGLMLFCHAKMQSGISTILDIVRFDEKIADADMVVTGEGKLDAQSAFGKAPVGIAQRVKRQRSIPVFAIVGEIGNEIEAVYKEGIDSAVSITPGPVSLDYAMHNVETLLSDTAERLMRIVKAVTPPPKSL